MISQYFGSFLLNKGYITRDMLKNMLEQEKHAHVKLGLLAIDKGMLTAHQVDEIHQLQRTQDIKFGELAIRLGYLSQQQIEVLLREQKSSQMELSQMLVDKGIFDLYTLERVIQEYRADSKLSGAEFEAIRTGDIDVLVESFMILPEQHRRKEYFQYISLFMRNMIRFIDRAAVFQLAASVDENASFAIKQSINGAVDMTTYLVMEESTYVQFAKRFAQMEICEKGELADASTMEFLNLHNGLFAVNLSDTGKRVRLSPPETVNTATLTRDANCIICAFDTELGMVYLLLDK